MSLLRGEVARTTVGAVGPRLERHNTRVGECWNRKSRSCSSVRRAVAPHTSQRAMTSPVFSSAHHSVRSASGLSRNSITVTVVHEVIYQLRACINSPFRAMVSSEPTRTSGVAAGEKTMPFGPNGEHTTVRLIDFDNPANNPSRQQPVDLPESDVAKRFDVVLLVNGLPIVIGEAKTPSARPSLGSTGPPRSTNYEKRARDVRAERVLFRHGRKVPLRLGAHADRHLGTMARRRRPGRR